ncbi:MAG: hypothetical protein LBR92_00950 [Puniceicoccales bacterium]|jgi:hypothetical protein|nr:hypothetical protein [Puniceicoccales bacterium]
MDTKIDQFCQKLESMVKEISIGGLGFSTELLDGSTTLLTTIFRTALKRYASDPECWKILERITAKAEQQPLQEVFTLSTEDDIRILSKFAESFYNEGEPQIAAQLFQFLTLFCPGGSPHPITYMYLAESISELSIDTGLRIYDFILNIFPDYPAILLAAAKRYNEGERPKRALRLLEHAKEVCEYNAETDPALKEFLTLLNPELEKIQQEIHPKE